MSSAAPLRRAVPLAVLPLSVVACGLASSPWLRAYPSSVLAPSLFGAALLSVLLPFVVVNIGVRKLWQSVLIDLVGFLFFVTLVALRQPLGYPDVWSGLVHGPSQILSYALPLVSPRTLLVVPVALCWLCGAVVGECIARGWQSVLPYLTVLVTFGLSYAATQRAVTNAADGRRIDTILAGALLVCLLLLRAVQVWVDQDSVEQGTGADNDAGGLPMRSVAVGTALAVLVAGSAALAVQSAAFTGRATRPARMPPVAMTEQLSPLSFVAGLRSANAGLPSTSLFKMTVDSVASRYISIGDVDSYNGDSWSFSRTFRPSGGVVPADTDPSLRPHGQPIVQQYTITGGQLAGSPWMPFEFRPQRIIGAGVDIDSASGMIVPSAPLHVGQRYSVTSDAALRTFGQLRRSALPGTSYQSVDLQLPVQVTDSLPPVISAFEHETRTSSASTVAFLQALAADLRTNYKLAGTGHPASSAPETPSHPVTSSPRSPSAHRSGHHRGSTPTHGRHPAPNRRPNHAHQAHHASASPSSPASVSPPATSQAPPTPSPAPTPSSSQAAGGQPGGTSLAAVLASILGESRTATPEQYATLVALIARKLDVPARVVTGFRLPTPGNSLTVEPGTYTITTRDAWTWVEIPIQGQGWVVLDPSPVRSSGQQASKTPGASQTPGPTSSPPPSGTLVTQAPPKGGNAAGPAGPPARSHEVAIGIVVAVVLAAIGALIVLMLVFAVLRKWLRVRRRRGAADPRRRVVGAWQETLDVLVESGLSDPRTLTSAELADATTKAFGPDPGMQAHYLGDCANLAIFSPAAPISAADAEAAWGAHVALRRAVRRRLPLGRRLASGLRYHRQPRVRAIVGPGSWDAAARARSSPPRSSRRLARHRRAH